MSSADVFVIGGGYSVKLVDLGDLWGTIVGVNDAALLAPVVHRVVSMDRLWTEGRWQHLCARKLPTWIRRSAIQNVHDRPTWLTVFECDHETATPSDDPARLNGTNSGLCALNLAYQMRPARIFLLGFDMTRGPHGEPYWYPAYTWAPKGGTSEKRYREWSRDFEPIGAACDAVGIDVYNVTTASQIETFPRVPPGSLSRMKR